MRRKQGPFGPHAKRRNRGQALVEFAIALPTLAFIMLGTLDMGQLFFEYIQLRGAVREAAAYGARAPADVGGIESAVYTHSAGLETGTEVEIGYDGIDDPADLELYEDGTITVTATRIFQPLMLSFFDDFGLGSVTLRTSASARIWT